MQRQSYKEDAAYVTCVSCVIYPPYTRARTHTRTCTNGIMRCSCCSLLHSCSLSQKHPPRPPLPPRPFLTSSVGEAGQSVGDGRIYTSSVQLVHFGRDCPENKRQPDAVNERNLAGVKKVFRREHVENRRIL